MEKHTKTLENTKPHEGVGNNLGMENSPGVINA